MGEGIYQRAPTRPPGRGWKLMAVEDGGHWDNKLWFRPFTLEEQEEPCITTTTSE